MLKDKKVSIFAVVVSISAILLFGAGFYVLAQFYVPLDTSPNAQTKEGGLTVNGGLNLGGSSAVLTFAGLTSNPTSAAGRMYYNSTTKTFKYNNGTAWVDVGSGSAPSGSLVGTYAMYYNQYDGSFTYGGCRASWGEADCTLGGGANVESTKCKTGSTVGTILYTNDTVGPSEYPCSGGTSNAQSWCAANYRTFHINYHGCFKN